MTASDRPRMGPMRPEEVWADREADAARQPGHGRETGQPLPPPEQVWADIQAAEARQQESQRPPHPQHPPRPQHPPNPQHPSRNGTSQPNGHREDLPPMGGARRPTPSDPVWATLDRTTGAPPGDPRRTPDQIWAEVDRQRAAMPDSQLVEPPRTGRPKRPAHGRDGSPRHLRPDPPPHPRLRFRRPEPTPPPGAFPPQAQTQPQRGLSPDASLRVERAGRAPHGRPVTGDDPTKKRAPERSINQLVGYIFAATYLSAGLFGFAVTTHHGFAATQAGQLISVFGVNGLHNVVHAVVGALLGLGVAGGVEISKTVNTLVGLLYMLVGVFGLVALGTAANVFALDWRDNLLHFGTAALLVLLGLFADRPRDSDDPQERAFRRTVRDRLSVLRPSGGFGMPFGNGRPGSRHRSPSRFRTLRGGPGRTP